MQSNSTDIIPEDDRLKSFKNWPISHIVSPKSLAEAGFYYLNQSDTTRCTFCNGILEEWEAGDDPSTEHQKYFPDCPFVVQQINPLRQRKLLRDSIITYTDAEFDLTSFEDLGINEHYVPKFQEFTTYDSRLETFSTWPENAVQKPEVLAEAGFFYVGNKDRVRCFSCGNGLDEWASEDDPWVEHAKYFPRCNNLILVKGRKFIEKYQNKESFETIEVPNGKAPETEFLSNPPEETDELRGEATICKVCKINEIGTILLPCAHVVVCVSCSKNLKDCPICGQAIKAVAKTFLS